MRRASGRGSSVRRARTRFQPTAPFAEERTRGERDQEGEEGVGIRRSIARERSDRARLDELAADVHRVGPVVIAFRTACCSAGVGGAGAAFVVPPPELLPRLEPPLLPAPLLVPPPPEPPPDEPPWPLPLPLPSCCGVLRAARRARLMTSRHAVYWSLSAGSWSSARRYVFWE